MEQTETNPLESARTRLEADLKRIRQIDRQAAARTRRIEALESEQVALYAERREILSRHGEV